MASKKMHHSKTKLHSCRKKNNLYIPGNLILLYRLRRMVKNELIYLMNVFLNQIIIIIDFALEVQMVQYYEKQKQE